MNRNNQFNQFNNVNRINPISYINPPSNNYPPDGYTNADPNAMFKSSTSNINNNFHDFNKGFQQNSPLIEKHDFKNKNNVLHDNLGENLLAEHLIDYRINIDSGDRDSGAFPNPFKYCVTFSPAPSQYIKEMDWIDPSKKALGKTIKSTKVSGTPSPCINRDFRNVKFIRLENIVLPKYTRIINDNGVYTIDSSSALSDERYIILKIKELTVSDSNMFGTNTYIENGYIIVADKTIGNNYYAGLPFYTTKTFPESSLGNINKLSFEFFNADEEPLQLSIVDHNLDPINERFDTDIKNRKNLNNIYNSHFQNHLSFTIGVFENQLNTNIKYEN